MKKTRLRSLLFLIVLSASVSGCATTRTADYMPGTEIVAMKHEGRDGFWVSEFFMLEHMQARVDKEVKNG